MEDSSLLDSSWGLLRPVFSLALLTVPLFGCTTDHEILRCGTGVTKHAIVRLFSSLLRQLQALSVVFLRMPLKRWTEWLDSPDGAGVCSLYRRVTDVVVFILEGIATVLVAVFAFFAIYDFPETASFLTEEERKFVVHRLRYDGTNVAMDNGFQWKYVRQAFCDWQIYLSLFIYWGTVV
jgi:hypothetical protein